MLATWQSAARLSRNSEEFRARCSRGGVRVACGNDIVPRTLDKIRRLEPAVGVGQFKTIGHWRPRQRRQRLSKEPVVVAELGEGRLIGRGVVMRGGGKPHKHLLREDGAPVRVGVVAGAQSGPINSV